MAGKVKAPPPTPVKLSVGRVRVTRAVVYPSEAAYIQSMRRQMQNIARNLQDVINHLGWVTADAIVYGLEPIYDESQRLVPVDRGKLKASGFLEINRRKNGVTVYMGYGRHGRPHYAAIVHERLDFQHLPPTQAKYLEDAVKTKLSTMERRIKLFMSKCLRAE